MNSKPRPLYFVRRDNQWCRTTGKLRMGKIEALMTLRETLAKRQHGQSNRAEERAYECRHCDGWHLTSQPFDGERNHQGS